MLGEAKLSLVIEHHGGPYRMARFAAKIAPASVLFWLQGVAALLTALALVLHEPIGAAIAGFVLLVLWMAPIIEAPVELSFFA